MTVGVRPQNCAFIFMLFIYAFYIVISNVVSSRPQIETSDTTSRDSQERGELRQVVISLSLFQIRPPMVMASALMVSHSFQN